MPGDESYDEHEDVRARLAAEPAPRMPADVATRLHAALAQEAQQRAAEQSEPVTPATVTPLRRRGRWKAPLLAAAGVVAIVAIGIPVINQSSDEDASGGDGGSVLSADDSGSGPSSGSTEDRAAPDADGSLQPAVPALTRDDFAADVRAQLVRADRLPATEAFRLDSGVRCSDGVPTSAAGQRATLDGDPALVLASRSDGIVPGTEVRAIVCGPDGPKVAARTTLPD